MAKVRYRDVSPELEKLANPNYSSSSRSSIGFENEVGEFYYFSVDDLVPYKNQARVLFDNEEICHLSETIKEHGIRQPLTVLKSTTILNKYEVVSGERRLRAAKMIGLEKVPCIIIKGDQKADEIALIENIQREDLHPVELARALSVLVEQIGHGGQVDVAKRVGLSKSQVSEIIKILDLSENVQTSLLENKVRGRELIRKLFDLEDDEARINLIRNVSSKNKPSKKISSLTRRSVLRVSISEDGVNIQKASINKLTKEQKEMVKAALIQVVNEID